MGTFREDEIYQEDIKGSNKFIVQFWRVNNPGNIKSSIPFKTLNGAREYKMSLDILMPEYDSAVREI